MPKKPGEGTLPDDIPAVHILEAAENQDRKETVDLIAGFDRPGRGPKQPSRERDFVDYYAKKKSGPDSGPSTGPSSASSRSSAPPAVAPAVKMPDVSTVVVRRKGDGMPAWLAWAAVAGLMIVVGGGVAYLATSDMRPSSHAPTGPSAATTITAATPVPQATNDNVPPPDPAVAPPTTTVTVVSPSPSVPDAPTRSSGRREPRVPPAGVGSQAPRGTNATDDSKAPKRDDFMRDL